MMTEDRFRLAVLVLIVIFLLVFIVRDNGRYQFHSKLPIILDTQTGKTFRATLEPQRSSQPAQSHSDPWRVVTVEDSPAK